MASPLSARLWTEASRFLAGCSSFGLVAEGVTRDRALEQLRTAISLYLDQTSPELEVVGPVLDGP